MCYPKPGPRCSPHAREQLDAAILTGDKAAIHEAQEAYYLTPRGIQDLKDAGKVSLAKRYQVTRQHMIEQTKARPKIRIGLDLDNTTGDFTAGFRQHMIEQFGITPEEALTRYPEPEHYQYTDSGWFKSGTEFKEAFHAAEKQGIYRKMNMYKDAAATLKKLAEDGNVEIHIVTARDKQWRSETLAWLRANHIPFASLTHTDAKEKTNMDIYIDDASYQLEKLSAHGKNVIAFNQLYNDDIPGLPRVHSWAEVPAAVRVMSKRIRSQQAKQRTVS